MSEFGGGALQGLHGMETERWTEEFQNKVISDDIAMLKNISFLKRYHALDSKRFSFSKKAAARCSGWMES